MRKEIMALAVLACLLLTSIQTVLADGPAIYGPFLAGARAPPQFYLDFIDMQSASMTLISGTYTFEMKMQSTPKDWMKPDWEPRFAPPHDKIVIWFVAYMWSAWDASGKILGVLEVYWVAYHVKTGTVYAVLWVCPATANYEACWHSEAGVGRQVIINNDPSLLTYSLDSAPYVSMTISQSEYTKIFPTATTWRCSTHAVYGSDISYVTEFADLPT
jgi:hypothetical protein